MKAAASESLRDTSPVDVVELLVAELRARRKYNRHLIHLVNQQAGREYGAMSGAGRPSGIKLKSGPLPAAGGTRKRPISIVRQRP
jgi:predicted hydrocarbon binding protein